eukprot:CAMPEP_0198341316 /NCGR_PEP_ID=MMETSP1450-20131203/47295_1 /TAXON_ID=753684 ORGANISM="Madagascaria erythrocladiodes, Strain CCMP3234" /NCGR_SAMPLE_ID=MMETSP1450 /ASSEMBLY_ACC=CAM_ASM_001115 /LENGTH=35 /DNA_ID= /DNA_START= /DNA_END= /DNA_ORIENTATION=
MTTRGSDDATHVLIGSMAQDVDAAPLTTTTAAAAA